MKKKLIFLGILLLLAFAFVKLGVNFKQAKTSDVLVKQVAKNTFSYQGEAGKNALAILKQKFSVSQDNSGIVNAIAGQKADGAKHEYWAFYVNGKMANVGPGDYETKNTDLIEWRIEKY